MQKLHLGNMEAVEFANHEWPDATFNVYSVLKTGFKCLYVRVSQSFI